MRRRFSIPRFRGRREARDADTTLRPLLSAVETATPPEGLFRDIESRIDGVPTAPGRGPAGAWHRVALSAGLTLAAGLAGIGVYHWPTDRSVLLDPAGRPVAVVEVRAGVTTVRWRDALEPGASAMVWHLWGLRRPGEPPVLLGPLEVGALPVPNASRFLGFALSLEARGFAGERPQGPLLALSPAE